MNVDDVLEKTKGVDFPWLSFSVSEMMDMLSVTMNAYYELPMVHPYIIGKLLNESLELYLSLKAKTLEENHG